MFVFDTGESIFQLTYAELFNGYWRSASMMSGVVAQALCLFVEQSNVKTRIPSMREQDSITESNTDLFCAASFSAQIASRSRTIWSISFSLDTGAAACTSSYPTMTIISQQAVRCSPYFHISLSCGWPLEWTLFVTSSSHVGFQLINLLLLHSKERC